MVFVLDVDHFTLSTYEVTNNFDLLKALGYIERVVNPIFFSEITYFTSYVRNLFWATIYIFALGLELNPDIFQKWISPI